MSDLSEVQQHTYQKIYLALGGKVTQEGLPVQSVKKALEFLGKTENQQIVNQIFYHMGGENNRYWTRNELYMSMHHIQQEILIKNEEMTMVEVQWMEKTGIQLIQNQIKDRESRLQQLRNMKEELIISSQRCDQEFSNLFQQSNVIRETTLRISHSFPSSPRSRNMLQQLDQLEEGVDKFERDFFSLVPKITKIETKTSLAVLSGDAEKFQAKYVDAIQSLGYSSQALIATRRRSLVKRLDVLVNLGKNLHQIASERYSSSS